MRLNACPLSRRKSKPSTRLMCMSLVARKCLHTWGTYFIGLPAVQRDTSQGAAAHAVQCFPFAPIDVSTLQGVHTNVSFISASAGTHTHCVLLNMFQLYQLTYRHILSCQYKFIAIRDDLRHTCMTLNGPCFPYQILIDHSSLVEFRLRAEP